MLSRFFFICVLLGFGVNIGENVVVRPVVTWLPGGQTAFTTPVRPVVETGGGNSKGGWTGGIPLVKPTTSRRLVIGTSTPIRPISIRF